MRWGMGLVGISAAWPELGSRDWNGALSQQGPRRGLSASHCLAPPRALQCFTRAPCRKARPLSYAQPTPFCRLAGKPLSTMASLGQTLKCNVSRPVDGDKMRNEFTAIIEKDGDW